MNDVAQRNMLAHLSAGGGKEYLLPPALSIGRGSQGIACGTPRQRMQRSLAEH